MIIEASLPTGDMTEMVIIPAGEFLMGSVHTPPEHIVMLDAYYIGRYEVTNAEYVAFLNAVYTVTDSLGRM